MEKKDSWKRTEEIEVDLLELLRRLCMQWKQAAACALACAALFAGYGYVMDKRDVPAADGAENAVLTEVEQQGVTAAVQLQHEIQELESYLSRSAAMQIDPCHKDQVVMLYSIDQAQDQDVPRIRETYLNFLQNGGAAAALAGSGSWDMDGSSLSELLKGYGSGEDPDSRAIRNTVSDQTLFFVETSGVDAQKADRLAKDVRALLKGYHTEVEKSAGSHRLSLLSSEANTTVDEDLLLKQHDKRDLLSKDLASCKVLTDAFSEAQAAAYKVAIGMEDIEGTAVATAVTAKPGISVKYILMGIFIGMFGYAVSFACWYLLYDTVKSARELKMGYTFPYLGGLPLKKCKGSHTQCGSSGREEAQIMNRIRLLCRKQGLDRVCLAAGFLLQTAERECLEWISARLKSEGIEAVIVEEACSDVAMWDVLAGIGNVIMVCRIGTTTHRMIDEEMSFYTENGIAVVGAAAFALRGA